MFAQNYITTGRRARYERHGRSLFQITRCAQNRLPRKQPAPAPDSEPTAIALRSPYRLANVARTPQRTPRPHTRAQTRPTRSPVPEKTSLSRATRSQRCLVQPHTRPTSSPRLRHFYPPIRPNPAISPPLLKYTHIRATLAYARERTRGPETQPANGVRPRAIRRGVPRGRTGAVKTRLSNPAPSPLSSVLLCHAASLLCPKNPLRRYRFARDRRHSQLRGAQNVAETNRLPAFAGITVSGGTK